MKIKNPNTENQSNMPEGKLLDLSLYLPINTINDQITATIETINETIFRIVSLSLVSIGTFDFEFSIALTIKVIPNNHHKKRPLL